VRRIFYTAPEVGAARVTPGARIAAAIAVLDEIAAGRAAEQALTNWARRSRYAGSGDRAAVRDLVYDAIRRRRSYAALAGVPEDRSGRVLMLGALTAAGQDAVDVFTGAGHAPGPLSTDERDSMAGRGAAMPEAVALDCPDWLMDPLKAALGTDFAPVMRASRSRAAVFLRVNTAKVTREAVIAELRGENISCAPHPLADTALLVAEGAGRVRHAAAYLEGRVEVQDGDGDDTAAGG
jgi:16S rRNA (cytosine967-C5)-methyltransferase